MIMSPGENPIWTVSSSPTFSVSTKLREWTIWLADALPWLASKSIIKEAINNRPVVIFFIEFPQG
jgi:hypothetical protein